MSVCQDRIQWGGIFSIILLPGWKYIQEQDVISLFKETQGVGSLQLSLLRRHRKGNTNYQEAMELTELFIADQKWEISREKIRQLEIAGCPATEFTHVESNKKPHFWQVWHIISNKRAVFITYNCDNDEANLELSARQTIVQSFLWEPSSATSSTPSAGCSG